mmetsp:Transcript_18699/g.58732  ORF Transcript_18699/g.58732 Transcript_18699/m.58732 type:complete len:388 (+) Transcript_18699:128-1291(+)
MTGPSEDGRLSRLVAARDVAQGLLAQPPAEWERECEAAFRELRLATLHLRRQREVLDALENKEVVWRFLLRFSRERPFQHGRCSEVLRILMASDIWMAALGREDPSSADTQDLPADVTEEFRRRAEAVQRQQRRQDAEANGGARAGASRQEDDSSPRRDGGRAMGHTAAPLPEGPLPTMVPVGVAVVVQRCTRARILIDEETMRWGEIGRGLVVSISFARRATEDRVRAAARFLLTAKLSCSGAAGGTAEDSQPARSSVHWFAVASPVSKPVQPATAREQPESVVSICRRGEDQGILVVPQASLLASVGKRDVGLRYDDWSANEAASRLYAVFVEALRNAAHDLIFVHGNPFTKTLARMPRVVAGVFGGSQSMVINSCEPFMHSFSF